MAVAVATAPPPTVFDTGEVPSNFRANSGHVGRDNLGWLRQTPADTPIQEIRNRLEADGYVFVKGLIPKEDVLAMREHFFSQYEGTGLLQQGTQFVDGIYNSDEDPLTHGGIGGTLSEGEERDRLTAAHKAAPYRRFIEHPNLRKMVRDIMQWDKEVMLERSMLRHNVPGGLSTGVHYDKLFLRGGPAFFLTGWVPIGDIRPTGGGLVYLKDSVTIGQAIEDDFERRAKEADFTPEEKMSAFNAHMTSTGFISDNPTEFAEEFDPLVKKAGIGHQEYEWLISGYEAGDVVFHHPCIVHLSGGNDDRAGRIRLSTDLRFYNEEDYQDGLADNRWMRIWEPADGL